MTSHPANELWPGEDYFEQHADDTVFDSELKAGINYILKGRGIRAKGQIFDMMNQGATLREVMEKIEELSDEIEAARKTPLVLRDEIAPYDVFGSHLITQNAKSDFDSIMRLPFVYGGALMPDGHRVKENHVPVGGVVVADAVVPGIVGSDIACSVFLTVTDMEVEPEWFVENLPSLVHTLREHAYFGYQINPDPIGTEMDFYLNPPELETSFAREILANVKKEVRTAFGTSGDGNHFAEWGTANVSSGLRNTGKKRQLALLTHFGSRVIGSRIAGAFEKLAMDTYEMPKGMTDAPLSLDKPEGRDYWKLMTWAGIFAEQGHRWLHKHLLQELSERVDLDYSQETRIYTKHNFAWETADGIVHRKGATPAAAGEPGVIPATMGDRTQIVIGLGNSASYDSASHGAGRTHSRTAALGEFSNTHEYVEREYGVHLTGGDADEDPRAYKRIDEVMAAQQDCVTTVGNFKPHVVRMADPRMGFSKRK
jgi:tRNA-splicing ligase RtcB (3'-phosphate/5'-hydroxy nucleic acid ligase)